VAILREGHVVIPQPETQIVAGDEVMAIATPETEGKLREAILGPSRRPSATRTRTEG
jgi:Trk K+ transport system NAD-binding subunit